MGKFIKYIVAIVAAALIVLKWDFFVHNFDFIVEEWNKAQTEETVEKPANSTPPIRPPSQPSKELPDIGNEVEQEKGEEGKTPPKNGGKGGNSLKIVTWNLYNIGISKSDEEIEFIAKLLNNYDIVAIQEISTKLSGPRAITKLNEELGRRGGKWDYVISDPTTGAGAERYAYLWRTNKVSVSGRSWLAKPLADKVDREPFMTRFKTKGGKTILLASFHAVPTAKTPAKEIILLDELHDAYRKDHLLIMGDFNLAQSHRAFNDLKKDGYVPVIENQKTSLRMKPKNGDYLAQEYDNIFYETATLQSLRSGVVDFVPKFKDLKTARQISDHLPVWCEITWR